MKGRIFNDTNGMLDFLGGREPFNGHAARIMSLIDRGIIQVCASLLS